MTIKYFDLKNCKIARENPRKKRTKEQVATLAESLADVGLIHNLAGYEENGSVHICAGGTRLDALRLLVKQATAGTRAVDKKLYTRIPVFIRPKAEAVDIALTSNEVSTAMTLAEQFTAYNALHKQGATPDDIAKRYYTDKPMVLRILALANLHKPIFAAFEAGTIDLETAKLYAGTNHARQAATWDALGETATSYSVRNALRENTYKATDKFVRFIGGVDAYKERGGVLEQDLFADSTVLCSGDIVQTLFDEAVAAHVAKLTEDGWENIIYGDALDWQEKDKLLRNLQSVQAVFKPDAKAKKRHTADVKKRDVLRTKYYADELTAKEETRFESLNNSIDHIEHLFSEVPAKIRAVGTVIWGIGHDGQAEHRYYKPAAKSKAAAATKKAQNYPNAFIEAANRTAGQALMDALVKDPNRLTMCLALAMLDRVSGGPVSAKLSTVGALKYKYDGYDDKDREFSWNDPHTPLNERVAQLAAMDDAGLHHFAARMIRRGFDMSGAGTLENPRKNEQELYHLLASSCGFNLADYWIMGEDEIKAMTKPQLLRCMAEIGVDVSAYQKSKKTELVKVFARLAKRSRWTPDFVRTHDPVGRNEAPSKAETDAVIDTPKKAAS